MSPIQRLENDVSFRQNNYHAPVSSIDSFSNQGYAKVTFAPDIYREFRRWQAAMLSDTRTPIPSSFRVVRNSTGTLWSHSKKVVAGV